MPRQGDEGVIGRLPAVLTVAALAAVLSILAAVGSLEPLPVTSRPAVFVSFHSNAVVVDLPRASTDPAAAPRGGDLVRLGPLQADMGAEHGDEPAWPRHLGEAEAAVRRVRHEAPDVVTMATREVHGQDGQATTTTFPRAAAPVDGVALTPEQTAVPADVATPGNERCGTSVVEEVSPAADQAPTGGEADPGTTGAAETGSGPNGGTPEAAGSATGG